MAIFELRDGTGSGRMAKVDNDKRLQTSSVITPVSAHIAEDDGQTYMLASDFISLTTTGSFNALMYVKNTSATRNLHIETIRTCSTDTGSIQIRLIKNPTAGTIISDANDSDKLNSNFSSNNSFSGLSYAASGDGKTITDGENFTQFINRSPGHSIQEYSGGIILGPGDSIGLTAKPSASTTICVEIQTYFTNIGDV
jgi:hypothetical protein